MAETKQYVGKFRLHSSKDGSRVKYTALDLCFGTGVEYRFDLDHKYNPVLDSRTEICPRCGNRVDLVDVKAA